MRRRLLLLVAVALTGCGDDAAAPSSEREAPAEAGASHIHGVGADPADGALYVATHTGLFRAAEGEQEARRVGESQQDTMGFTVAGERTFLGSGHPDAQDDLPPLLGLIRSEDAGKTWTPVSLLGEADFHVLRAAGRTVYGFDATQGRLMASADGGASWKEHRPPAAVFDLAIDPRDPRRLIAATEQGLFLSRDAGARWRPLDPSRAGLLAWGNDGVVLVDGSGAVQRSADGGRRWIRVGDVGGQPAALSRDGDLLHAGLHSNEVKVSADGGRTWRLRAVAR